MSWLIGILIVCIVLRISIPFMGTQPDSGLKLRELDGKPHGVSSMAQGEHFIEGFVINTDDVENQLESIMKKFGAKLIFKEKNYYHYSVSTTIVGYTDDVEFLIDAENKRIEVRSSSRLGTSDFGANRKRIEQLRKIFAGK